MIEWLVRGPATEICVHVDVLVRRYSTMLVAGSSVAHVTVALFDVADAFTAVIAGGVVSIGGGLPLPATVSRMVGSSAYRLPPGHSVAAQSRWPEMFATLLVTPFTRVHVRRRTVGIDRVSGAELCQQLFECAAGTWARFDRRQRAQQRDAHVAGVEATHMGGCDDVADGVVRARVHLDESRFS